jgi:dTDP-4-dehydrorhamnose reductase
MINALFPHQLAQVCELNQVKMIHISTDCVFSGKVGNYSELDIPDGPDLYGRTKLLGEVTGPKALTFRTSLIGRELLGASGLVEWFLSQQGKEVWGYSRSIFSGFTTQAFGKFLLDVIENHGDLQGIWHISSDPISKYDLLQLFKKYFKISIHINGNETLCCDRSLNSGRFRSKFGFLPPTWQEMVQQLAEDPTPYHQMRRIHVNQ